MIAILAYIENAPAGQFLSRQFLTALCAATRQHFATILGGHAKAETMRALAAAIRRLECTFHETALKVASIWQNCSEKGVNNEPPREGQAGAAPFCTGVNTH